MADFILGVQQFGSTLKIAAFKQGHNRLSLQSVGRLSTNFDENKTSADLKAWVSTNLPQAENVTAIITIPESSIFFKVLSLPKIPDKKIGETAKWELLSDTPIPIEQAVYDWFKLSQEQTSIEVLTMLVKSEVSDILVSIFEKAGLEVLAIEPSSSAYFRTIQEDFEKPTLLISLEEDNVNLIIAKAETPIFSTTVKVSIGSKGTKETQPGVSKTIFAEAKKIIEFWQEKNQSKIEKIVLTEGLAIFDPQLGDDIGQFFNLKTLVSKEAKISKISFEGFENKTISEYLVPVGAVLRTRNGQEPNFLPPNKKEAINKKIKLQKNIKFAFFFTFLNIFLVFLTAIIYTSMVNWNMSLMYDINQTKDQINNHPAHQQLAEIKIINQKINLVSDLLDDQKNAGDRLKIIASLTPNDIYLTSIDFTDLDNEKWVLTGNGDRQTVLAYHQKLSSDTNAKQVSMPYSNFSQESGDFQLIVTW